MACMTTLILFVGIKYGNEEKSSLASLSIIFTIYTITQYGVVQNASKMPAYFEGIHVL